MPGGPDLAGAAIELVNEFNRERKLEGALLAVRNDYDYIIIDNAPTLGLLTINGLVASDSVLIPVQAEYYALEGLGQLLETIELIRRELRPSLAVLGAIITMYESRLRLSNDVMEELYRYFPNRVFRSVIPRNVRLTEAPSHGRPVFLHDMRSSGSVAYLELTKEVLSHG